MAPTTPVLRNVAGYAPRSHRAEHGLETPEGTATSSPSAISAPRTPNDILATRVAALPDSDASSEAVESEGSVKVGDDDNTHNSVDVHTTDNPDPFTNESGTSPEVTPYRPRPDRFGVEITPDIAQAVFPADACVFVANLIASKSDDAIAEAVREEFSAFGTCYVKVKRDGQQMPYAFCQYEKVEHSNRAIVEGRKLVILGRVCRTERAKVNRSLYLSRITGGSISEPEARVILQGHGDIQSIWISNPTDMEMFRLPDGIWVQFAFFQDARDAANTFKNSPDFRLEQPQLPEDLRARLTNTRVQATPSRTPARRGLPSTPVSRHPPGFSEGNSLFVGNLNTNVTLDALRAVFSKFGSLRNIEIVCRPGGFGNTIHAFIEYDSPRAADHALSIEHILGNAVLRVERRQSTILPFGRTPNSRFSSGSPRRRNFGGPGNALSSGPSMGSPGGFVSLYDHYARMGADPQYSMHAAMAPFYHHPFGTPSPTTTPVMSSGMQPMMYGAPAPAHFGVENGFTQGGFHAIPPPQFALPGLNPMMNTICDGSKNSALPSVPEHQGS